MIKLAFLAVLGALGLAAQSSIFVPADGSYVGATLSSTNPTGACVASKTVYNYLTGHTWVCAGAPGSMVWTDSTSTSSNGAAVTPSSVNGDTYVDGSTYANLNAAFSALAAKPAGGVIHLSSGTYGITSSLTEPEQSTGVSIIGAGSANTVIQANAAMTAMLYKADTAQGSWTLSGLTLQCNSGSTINAQYALQLLWARGVVFSDLQLNNCGTEDFALGGGAAGHQSAGSFYHIYTNYNENVFTFPGTGSGATPPNYGIELLNNAYDSEWVDIQIRNAHVTGLKIDATASGHSFTRLHVFGYAGSGILPYAPSYGFEDATGGNRFYETYFDGMTVSGFHFSMVGTSANDLIEGGTFYWVSGPTWPATANFGTLDQQYTDWSLRNFWVSGLQTANIWTVAATPTASLFGARVLFDDIFGTNQTITYYAPTTNRNFNGSTKTSGAVYQPQGSFAYLNGNTANGSHNWAYKDKNSAEIGFINDFGQLSFSAANIYGSMTGANLATPVLNALTTNGAAGSSTCTYLVQAFASDKTSHGLPSATGTIATCNATLSSSNSVNVTWPAIAGAWSYKVYRTVGGASVGWLSAAGTSADGFVNTNSLIDTGYVGDTSTATASNNSGRVFGNSVNTTQFASNTGSNSDFSGEVTLSSATTATVNLTNSGAFSSHPECTPHLQFNAALNPWITYTGTASFAINFASAVTGTVGYSCAWRN